MGGLGKHGPVGSFPPPPRSTACPRPAVPFAFQGHMTYIFHWTSYVVRGLIEDNNPQISRGSSISSSTSSISGSPLGPALRVIRIHGELLRGLNIEWPRSAPQQHVEGMGEEAVAQQQRHDAQTREEGSSMAFSSGFACTEGACAWGVYFTAYHGVASPWTSGTVVLGTEGHRLSQGCCVTWESVDTSWASGAGSSGGKGKKGGGEGEGGGGGPTASLLPQQPITPSPVSSYLPALHTLGLAYNRISARGMKYLAKVLPRAVPSLTTLLLEWNGLKDEGVLCLVASALLLGYSMRTVDEEGDEEETEADESGGEGEGEEERIGGAAGGEGDDEEVSPGRMEPPPSVRLGLTRLTLGKNRIGDEGAQALQDYVKVSVSWAMYLDLDGGGGGGPPQLLPPPVSIDLADNKIGDAGFTDLARALFPMYHVTAGEEELLARRVPTPTLATAARVINLSNNPVTCAGPLDMLERLESSVREGTRLWAKSRGGGGSIIGVCLKDGQRSKLNRALARSAREVVELFKKIIVL